LARDKVIESLASFDGDAFFKLLGLIFTKGELLQVIQTSSLINLIELTDKAITNLSCPELSMAYLSFITNIVIDLNFKEGMSSEIYVDVLKKILMRPDQFLEFNDLILNIEDHCVLQVCETQLIKLLELC